MNILHLRNSDIFGSPERLIIGQMFHLHEFNSYCASFIKTGKTSAFLDALKKNNLNSIAIESKNQMSLATISQIKKILKTKQINLIISHDYKATFYSFMANRSFNLPHIGYYHGRTDENFKVKLYNFIDGKILARLPKILTVSNATSDYLNKIGISKDKIEVVYNAIEIDDDHIPRQKPASSAPIIGVIGRLSHEKGVHIFLKSIDSIIHNCPNVQVLIFGDGPDRDKLKRLTQSLGLTKYIIFKGFEKDLDKIYSQLDIIVIPSLSEGHPLIILEAWKYAIGIVATKAGGIPEIITSGKTGLLAEVNDPDSLGQKILEAVSDLPAMKIYGQNGLSLLKEQYSFASQAKKLSQIYKKMINMA